MNLMRFRWLYYLISLALILPGLWSIAVYGLRLGIDFTGGSVLEVVVVGQQPILTNTATSSADLNATVSAQVVDSQLVASSVDKVIKTHSVVKAENDTYIIKAGPISNDLKNLVLNQLRIDLGSVTEQRFDTVGPALSQELLIKTIWSVVIAVTCITIYLWRQFKEVEYGICATLAMVHDILMVVGIFSILGIFWPAEVDVLFVTALLTTLTFSVHDTIVMYDRIRELLTRHPRHQYHEVVNAAVWQTLARSFNTSFTIIIMLAALVILGGGSIRWFATALLIGAVTGTYSSPFVSVPLLIEWHNWKNRRKK